MALSQDAAGGSHGGSFRQLRSQNYDCLKVLPKISPMSSVQHRRFEKRHFLKRLPQFFEIRFPDGRLFLAGVAAIAGDCP